MNNNDSFINIPDEDILIIDDTQTNAEVSSQSKTIKGYWKAIIVDDDHQVHQVTKLALKNFVFEGKAIAFISAYSGEEAKQLIAANADTAFILLDVVMETKDAGLRLAEYIRSELNNKIVRIILRTGQPGDAPEESVILNYDINDYKLKVELTQHKLTTSIISALRSYRDLVTIERQNIQLTQALDALEQTQLQMIQSEKMSSLGNLVIGIAHEINNPVNFIIGNLQPAFDYVQNLFGLIELLQKELPNPNPKVEAEIEEIDLEYLREDLPKLLGSIKEGAIRICNISNSLRVFARADTEQKMFCDLNKNLESTLHILKYRLKASPQREAIEVRKEFGDFRPINCFPGQLNQVFMNIISNAIDALEESIPNVSAIERSQRVIKTPFIHIVTELTKSNTAIVSISDNGIGMTEEVQNRIFDRLYTTKGIGKGTGLGLSISRQIVEELHGGKLSCFSKPGEGTEFVIEIPAS